MKFAATLLILLLALTSYAVDGLKLSRVRDQMVVSFKNPKLTPEDFVEVVLTDTNGNVVRECIGGKISGGRAQCSLGILGISGDHFLNIRLAPLDPKKKFHVQSWRINIGKKISFVREQPEKRGPKAKVPDRIKAAYAAAAAVRPLPPAPPVAVVRPSFPRIGVPRSPPR